MVHFQEPPVIFQGIFQFPNGFLKSNSKHHLSVQTQCVTFFIWYWLVDIQASLKRGFWTNTNNTPLKDSLNSSQRKSLSKNKSQQKKQPTNTQIRKLFLQSHISTSPHQLQLAPNTLPPVPRPKNRLWPSLRWPRRPPRWDNSFSNQKVGPYDRYEVITYSPYKWPYKCNNWGVIPPTCRSYNS